MNTIKLYKSVERLSELLKVGARKAGAEHGLQPVQLEILHYLSTCNKYSDTPMAVTEYLGQTKGTVSQSIKTLVLKGLVEKIADENDKRTTHLAVTATGIALLGEVIPSELFVNACDQLSESNKEQISQALNTLLKAIIQTNNMKTFGVCHSCKHNRKLEDGSYYCNLVKVPLTLNDISLICREHEN
ncbi:MarR family winged helix-turn-helix transcriptional regulator [Flocculibacter collagenilyticus]|uniref:MarR family winged helix-turn-helix transcriptional regulator n=1 Tax=Flocculibacter collagenilyticus TaxID=2744479 RepID=UPI0018F415D2|nr:MarR family winged helix-turn-helix transcriptional regulator [Flocculibacter collagenilyticus]